MSGRRPFAMPGARGPRLRAGRVAVRTVLALQALLVLWPASAAQAAQATQVAPVAPVVAVAASLAGPWWQQFDDPVLTALLAPLGEAQPGRAQALARQWVAVRVYHLQGATADALGRMARAQQAALMDLPADTPGRDDALARVATQLAQAQRHAEDRAARRDQALAEVAQLSGLPGEAQIQRLGAALSDGRLPHLVAEPPTLRVTLSAHTSEQAQRLTTLHACHEAARQADRAVLAARQALAQARALAPAGAPPAGPAGPAGASDDLPTDAATAQATQALLLAISRQAATAGDLALAWLEWLAIEPAAPPARTGAGHTATRAPGKPV
ncbi:hypothetical protein AACH10_15665 [Ideonella sp. DXS22W]|uniref:DUF3300 domain-containing protein n=1 Tax=Pseudaquabacterium inlustre TaxID=2984192 RepID=A0ABU9CIK5_9BURK